MPLLDRPWVVAAALAYLALMIGIGVWAAGRTRSARDFFIAGQGVGLAVTGLATMSAAFSGFVFVGGPGLTYRLGVASLWIVLPVGFTSGLLCWVLAKRLRLLAEVREIYTIPDVVASRFESSTATGLASVAVVCGSVAYLGAQFLALGVLLQAIFGFETLGVAIAVGLVVVVGYSVAGGMVAGVYTDVVQGAIMLLAAVAIFARALDVTGGWTAMIESIVTADAFGPTFVEPFGEVGPLVAFGFFFVFGVGVLGQPQMLHKFFMLDDPRKLRHMPWVLGGSQAVCLFVWIGIGMAVPALVAQGKMEALASPDDATPAFLLGHTPELLAGLVLAALLAAIMSTADSFLNIGAAGLVRDLPRAIGRPVGDELRWARWAVVVLAVAAAATGWLYGDLIALLGTFAFGTFGAALAPALAIGMNWARVTPAAAIASIATGIVLNLGLELAPDGLPFPAAGISPSVVSLAASFAVLLTVTAVTRPRPLDPTVRDVMES
jgi:Na+/proline symporter